MQFEMKRTVVALFLVLVGSFWLAYGLLFHRVTLEETKQREVPVAVSMSFGMEEATPESEGEAKAPPEKSAEPAGGTASDEVDPFRSPTTNDKPTGDADNPFESRPDASNALSASAPGVKFEKRTVDEVECHEESESTIVREVTFDGVALLANGHLKRTYSGAPPKTCPT
jgi:hypothetical protein